MLHIAIAYRVESGKAGHNHPAFLSPLGLHIHYVSIGAASAAVLDVIVIDHIFVITIVIVVWYSALTKVDQLGAVKGSSDRRQ